MRKIFLLILISFAYTMPLTAGEDDERKDHKALYLYPHEAIRSEEIQLLDSETRLKIDPESGIAAPWVDPNTEEEEPTTVDETPDVVDGTNEEEAGENANEMEATTQPEEETGPKSLETQIREAEGLLKRYYSQFLSEKRIWEDKNRGSKYSTKNEQNEVRLLIHELNSRLSESNLIRDSEIVYTLHRRLGDLYIEKGETSQAIRHLQASLNYRNLSAEEDYFINEKIRKEVLDPESIPKRESHTQSLENLKDQKNKVEDEKKLIHRIGSNYAREKIDFATYQESKKSAELNLEREKQNLKNAKAIYEKSLEENYLPFRKKKSREDSETLYKLAGLVQKVETANKERMKVINKTSYAGRGVFVLFDYKRNSGFSGYEYLLEQAYRLDPTNPKPIKDVAYQFKLDGKKQKAIDYYNKYIDLYFKENPNGILAEDRDDLANVYLNLAILNSDIKRKVLAAENYDLFLNTSQDEEKKKSLYYELGRFYEKQIGDLTKAKTYYMNWLDTNPEDSEEKLCIAHYGISLQEKKDQRIEREETQLLEAYKNYKSLREQLSTKEQSIVELEREINRYKRELLITTNDESLAQYRMLQLRIEDSKLERDKIKSRYQSIPNSKIILRLAEISESKKDLQRAMDYYKEAIDIGNEVEVRFALSNIKRLELTMSDGIKRKKDRLY